MSDTNEILSPDEEVIHEQNKTIERLQKQLKEANEAIKEYSKLENLMSCAVGPAYEEPPAKNYLKKWGVK